MGQYSKLGKNTALVFLGSAGSKLVSLFMLPYYTRWLTADDYGITDLISTYSSVALVIISCSLFDSLFIFPKGKSINMQCQYFSTAMCFWIVSIGLTALSCSLIKSLGLHYGWHGFLIDNIWLIFGILATSYLQSLLQQFLRAVNRMVVYSMVGLIITLGIVTFAFVLIPRWKVNGYVLSIIIGNTIGIIYSFIGGKLRPYLKPHSISFASLKEMLGYSIPLIPNGLMWFLINALNRPIIENYCGLASVGIFAVAGRFPGLLNTVYLLFQQAWLISVLEEASKPGYEVYYNRMLKIVVVFQCLLAAILTFCGKGIIELFTTPEFYSSWQYIPVLVVGVLFMNVGTFVGSNFAVMKKSKYYFYSTIWAGITSVILNFLLVPYWGLWGVCLALVASQAVVMITRIKYSLEVVKVTDYKFYILNGIFITASIFSGILLKDSLWLYLVIVILSVYFFYVNRNQICATKQLVISIYESCIKNK